RPLTELVLQLLADDPRERPQAAGDVRRELESIDPSIRRPLAERLGTATLVGRERELAAIEVLLGRKLKRPRMVVVGGPRGMGKRAFLAEVATRAAVAGHPVVRLQGPGLRTIGQAFGDREVLEQGVANGDPKGPESRSAEESRFPTFYVLDDAHALDAESRRLIRRALVEPEPTPSILVLARDAAVPAPDDERMLLESGLADLLSLLPLDETASAGLVAARLGEPAPQRLKDFLWRAAGGHPGLIVATLVIAANSGALRESQAGLVVDGEA